MAFMAWSLNFCLHCRPTEPARPEILSFREQTGFLKGQQLLTSLGD